MFPWFSLPYALPSHFISDLISLQIQATLALSDPPSPSSSEEITGISLYPCIRLLNASHFFLALKMCITYHYRFFPQILNFVLSNVL